MDVEIKATCSQPRDYLYSGNQRLTSRAAASGESEACTTLASIVKA